MRGMGASRTSFIWLGYLLAQLCWGLEGRSSSSSPCDIRKDPHYGGTLTDCSGRGLTSLDPEWFPLNTTTLLLDSNELTILKNFTFQNLRHLVKLSATRNHISRLEIHCLKGLPALRYLHLRANALNVSKDSYPKGLFTGATQLQDLDIAANIPPTGKSPYKPFGEHFSVLSQLRGLSVDSSEVLEVGPEFSQLRHLKRLTVRGEVLHSVKNSSLLGLASIPLEELSLESCPRLASDFENGTFQHVANVRALRIQNCHVGNRQAVQSLWPFANKSLDVLEFIKIHLNLHYTTVEMKLKDGMITSEIAKYLGPICVHRLVWTSSYLIEMVLDKMEHINCLTYVDISGNLFGEFGTWKPIVLFSLFIRMQKLEKVVSGDLDYTIEDLQRYLSQTKGMAWTPQAVVHRPVDLAEDESGVTNLAKDASSITVLWPSSLATIIFFRSRIGVEIDGDVYIKNGHVLKEVYFVNSKHVNLNGKIHNLNNVTLLDMSGSDVQWGDNNPFNDVPNLQVLRVNSLRNEKLAHSVFSNRLTQNLTQLVSIEASGNNMVDIPDDVFATNTNLLGVLFKDNRLTNIPIDLGRTPSLRYLDLSSNAILHLTTPETDKLDAHALQVGNFSLFLSGNRLLCGCEQIQFLQWLQTTQVTLDNRANYTCMTASAHLASTADLADFQALRRHCVGPVAFWISLLLLSVYLIGFLATYTWTKLRTMVWAFLLNVFAPTYRMKTAQDYPINVFFGYADDDFRFIRGILQPFIEDTLNFDRTYIHQRDLRGGYLDEQLIEAIQNSWRILLVVSHNFLHNYRPAQTVMKISTGSIPLENPGLVVLLVHEAVRYQVPDYLLNVLDEEKIISLQSWTEPLAPGQKVKLRVALKA